MNIREAGYGVVLGMSLAFNGIFAYALTSGAPAKRVEATETKVGSILPPLPIRALDGSTRILDASGDRPTVVYVLSPACGWCRRNTDNFKAIAQQTSHTYNFSVVSTVADGLEKYLAEHPVGVPAAGIVSTRDLQAWGFSGTPLTVVLSPTRQVLAVWHGAYGGSTATEVERFFKVRLPGLGPQIASP